MGQTRHREVIQFPQGLTQKYRDSNVGSVIPEAMLINIVSFLIIPMILQN